MNNLPYQANNAEFNPLFVKMQARFSYGNKTIAETMLERAAKYEAASRRTVPAEVHMTKANFLPKKATDSTKRRFFSLGTLVSFCLFALLLGTLLFSGALINKMAVSGTLREMPAIGQQGEPVLYTESTENTVAESMILPEEFETGALRF